MEQRVIRIATALIRDPAGRMLVVRKRGTTSFMLPGGKIEMGESAVDALRRELREELALDLPAVSLTALGLFRAAAANEPGWIVEAQPFLADRVAEPVVQAEIEEMRWVDPAAPGDLPLAPLIREHLLPLCVRLSVPPGREDQSSEAVSDAGRELERLIGVMQRLRDPVSGCPWDIDQTPETIAPFAIEEAYEVLDAITRDAWDDVADELGDLLLQVVYQSRMAEEEGRFAFATVARLITDKMIRRHPHVFGEAERAGAEAGDMLSQWENRKEQERARRAEHGVLAGVARSLPALLRARKLAARAARVGFDWPDVSGVVEKVREELAEVEAEIASGDRAALQDEMGDLLFSVASLARRLDLDPEACLRQANDKFTRRFEALEAILASRGETPGDMTVEQLDAVWCEVKRREAAHRQGEGL